MQDLILVRWLLTLSVWESFVPVVEMDDGGAETTDTPVTSVHEAQVKPPQFFYPARAKFVGAGSPPPHIFLTKKGWMLFFALSSLIILLFTNISFSISLFFKNFLSFLPSHVLLNP